MSRKRKGKESSDGDQTCEGHRKEKVWEELK